ncbi:dipeptide/oligopeptide/nickel ABC transporter permease/ATP-binding protein [Arthrobacter sp. B1I2]|uniref:dipeptide/oligopeptide/nickel ABC transporter permease/ATP-binding protein n=1 Tax=Arthrobacter sp. B1I2 TaxID=3042263 RepID=UPI00277F2054|nr:dipeptide/oligopeptide/nickel ABC transporter permease/ATP-binding protein [Arthrobacter sp. B1I2]MDQ0729840.1 peptide/nickel transport system permease protein [Arthrobacter sp. B1I2]
MIPTVAPAPADADQAGSTTPAAAPAPSAGKAAITRLSRHRLLTSPGAVAGLIWLAAIVTASLTAPLWLPFKTEDQDFTAVLSGPTAAHWLGTDELGRDILSRIFAAAAGTLGTSMLTVIVGVGLGTILAMLAAGAGERTEAVISRVTEIMMSLPGTVIILAVIGAVGTNIPVVMAILGILMSAGIYRVILGQAKSLQSQLYVDAAKVDGVGPLGISLRHVLPGLANTIVVQAALIFAVGMLIQAGLAFIGFGPPIPQPSWGGMIQGASQHVYDAPWLMVPTGAVLALTVLSANAIGNALGKAPNAAAPHLPSAAARRQRAKAVAAIAAAPAPVTEDGAATGTLSVRSLSVGVDNGVPLVTDVSFDVQPGTVLGLVGESGCGKTMTALSLLGLLPSGVSATGGRILWNGRNLAGATEKDMEAIRGREIALISQEPMRALDPMFTVGYQLTATIRRLRGMGRAEARKEAQNLLEKVGIVDAARILKTYPHQISGGMAQRVAIALALSGQPKLLVADEPTTALDVTVQAEILSLLRTLVKDTGMSVVMVTHDLGVVADICDQVAVMYAGQVVENGKTSAVLDHPRHPYALALLAADPHANHAADMPERLATISGQVPQPKDWPTGCRFAARCQFAGSACTEPVPLLRSGTGEGLVRCVKADQLAVEGMDWLATDVPASRVLKVTPKQNPPELTGIVEKDLA